MGFRWDIYILPFSIQKVKVKVMHISTVSSMEMVTDILINKKAQHRSWHTAKYNKQYHLK